MLNKKIGNKIITLQYVILQSDFGLSFMISSKSRHCSARMQ